MFSAFLAEATWWQVTGQWRVQWPMDAWRAQGYPVDFWSVPLLELPEQIMRLGSRRPDLIVLPRLFGPSNDADRMPECIAWHVGLLQALGCAVAVDLGNDPRREQPEVSAANAALLRACDGATVTTAALAEVARRYVRPDVPVVVAPNAIAPAAYLAAAVRRDRVVSIGCAFTPRSLDNLEATGMAAAWQTIVKGKNNT